MPERKVWTEEQDKVLKLLKEERGERKWARIARVMEQEFELLGRTGKQCRERYHNHLDSAIVSAEWSPEEEQVLYEMHEEIGNKWSLIAQKLAGRSDNCVKNHFYSKLRKSLRRLNKLIHDYFGHQFALVKEAVLSKIIKATESKYKASSKIDEELADFCNDIKNRLFWFSYDDEENLEDVETAKQLITDIEVFDKDFKKGYKGFKFYEYLKPPPPKLKKHSSTRSESSELSESSISSFLSSSMGSCSDLSDLEGAEEDERQGKSERRGSSGRTSTDNTVKSCDEHTKKEAVVGQVGQAERMESESPPSEGMKMEPFGRQFEEMDMRGMDYYCGSPEENIHLSNIYYDNTPVIARIFGPTDLESLELFGKEGVREGEEDSIEFKLDRMEL